jgi:uncharacterized membrane protein YgcG
VRTWLTLAAAMPLVLVTTPALAQPLDEPPASDLPAAITLAYVDGQAEIARDAGLESAQAPDVLEAGDRLLTRNGRAELVFADGTVVHVAEGSDVRIDDAVRLRIDRGRLLVRTSAAAAALDVATPVGIVRLDPRGEYEIAARDLDGDTAIATYAGYALLAHGPTDLPIAVDSEVAIDPRGAPPRFTRAGVRHDAFTDWAAGRMNEMRHAAATQPLPVELSAYAPGFSSYGRWDSVLPYGRVWFPTVNPGWRPYSLGSWRYTRYGWTWIDAVPWGWPVHHYGRWGRHARRGWYWIPHRAWAPAWVGWAVQSDYVGWAPLGWNARPLVDFFVGARVGPIDVWAGTWSIVPRGVFGRRGPYGPYFTDLRRLPGPVLGGFVTHARGPAAPHGWSRRVTPAPRYGRPTAAARPSWANDRAPGWPRPRSGDDRSPGGRIDTRRPRATAPPPSVIDYTSRGGRRGSPAGTVESAPERDPAAVAPPADAPASDTFRERPAAPDPAPGRSRSPRDPRGWRSPGASGDDPRQASPRRPQDAPPPEAAAGAPPRRAAPEYGRPAPVPGRAWGRPDAAEARPRGAGPGAGRSDGGGRSGGSDGRGESAGRSRARGGDGAASGGGSGGGVSAGARQGGRRSPR